MQPWSEHITATEPDLSEAAVSALTHVCKLSLALTLAVSAARADDADLSLGGFICARPFAPACVEALANTATIAGAASCQSEVDRFVTATAAYRDCLQHQISGAIRRVNDVVDHFHCLSQHESCPPPAKSPARTN
jgi:hypothetical protein